MDKRQEILLTLHPELNTAAAHKQSESERLLPERARLVAEVGRARPSASKGPDNTTRSSTMFIRTLGVLFITPLMSG